MKREELTDALRTEAEWAADHDYDIPLMLCGNLRDAVTLLESDAAEIAALKAENERIRQTYVAPEVYHMACDERDAAVNDLSLTNTRKFNNPCEICKHNGEKCEPVDLQSVCYKWEWRGLQKEK